MSDRTKLGCILAVLNRIAKLTNEKTINSINGKYAVMDDYDGKEKDRLNELNRHIIRFDAERIFANLSSKEIDFYYRHICDKPMTPFEANAHWWLVQNGVSA